MRSVFRYGSEHGPVVASIDFRKFMLQAGMPPRAAAATTHDIFSRLLVGRICIAICKQCDKRRETCTCELEGAHGRQRYLNMPTHWYLLGNSVLQLDKDKLKHLSAKYRKQLLAWRDHLARAHQ